MTIKELYEKELCYWTAKNIEIFGITPVDATQLHDSIQACLDADAKKYWNCEKPCLLVQNLNNGKLNKDYDKLVKNSYRLHYNILSSCVDVYATYNKSDEFLTCVIPLPTVNLTWVINNSEYAIRTVAIRDYYSIVSKKDNKILGEGWTFDLDTKQYSCMLKSDATRFEPTKENCFNHLSDRSKALLTASIGKQVNIDNFEEAMENILIFPNNSIFNYRFARFEFYERLITRNKNYAQPIKGRFLALSMQLKSRAKIKNFMSEKELDEYQLILCTNKLFALDNFRTSVNIYNSSSAFTPDFTYCDSIGFFDAFKTSTNLQAGRQRLMLDNISIHNGMMWVTEKDGTEHNMFEYISTPQKERVSCLSRAEFGNNDKPKRIMMNAKLSAQAVTLKDEEDDFTHRVNARVGFVDIEGLTYADAIVISASFAEKLRTHKTEIIAIEKNAFYKELVKKKKSGVALTEKELRLLLKKSDAIIDSLENVKITEIDEDDYGARIYLYYEIAFHLGDKLTNLHGAKGTAFILPDDEMPKLLNKVGNMEAGPLEVLISGFSTIRRGSLGQIFEAWAAASGIDFPDGEDFISNACSKYSNQMKEYADKSIVEFHGQKIKAPVGLNKMMRLYHHTSVKVSESSIHSRKKLRLGEMEKLGLYAQDKYSILTELAIRSLKNYAGSRQLITEMQSTGELPTNLRKTLPFASILSSFGYDFKLDDKSMIHFDSSTESDIKLDGLIDNILKNLTDTGGEHDNN